MNAARSVLRRAMTWGLLGLAPLWGHAEPEALDGPGRELFVARCTVCHSIDYVEMHTSFGTRALWETEVAKMRNAFKAPMSDDDARVIVEYLTLRYGPQRTMPSSSISKTNVDPGRIAGGAPRSP